MINFQSITQVKKTDSVEVRNQKIHEAAVVLGSTIPNNIPYVEYKDEEDTIMLKCDFFASDRKSYLEFKSKVLTLFEQLNQDNPEELKKLHEYFSDFESKQ